jgi:hypothetical protein
MQRFTIPDYQELASLVQAGDWQQPIKITELLCATSHILETPTIP